MITTATNRKIRELLTQLREGSLEPHPDFQRRLVWSNKDKSYFIQTILLKYPFPEVYIAAGDVDLETGKAKEMLVDGQQRITTLNQYFLGSADLKLSEDVPPYSQLSNEAKEAFLQYDVVVRDLGKAPNEQIIEVFTRINSTKYGLNAMEIHNARYGGEYKIFAEGIAQLAFFEKRRIFSVSEIRRMEDTLFALGIITTILSTYFNREVEIENYLKRYNDEFPLAADVTKELNQTFSFIDQMGFNARARAWKKADLFTLIVEAHRALMKDQLRLSPDEVCNRLADFYAQVNSYDESNGGVSPDVSKYHKAALQATNDRGSRIARGDVVRKVIRGDTLASAETATPADFEKTSEPNSDNLESHMPHEST